MSGATGALGAAPKEKRAAFDLTGSCAGTSLVTSDLAPKENFGGSDAFPPVVGAAAVGVPNEKPANGLGGCDAFVCVGSTGF